MGGLAQSVEDLRAGDGSFLKKKESCLKAVIQKLCLRFLPAILPYTCWTCQPHNCLSPFLTINLLVYIYIPLVLWRNPADTVLVPRALVTADTCMASLCPPNLSLQYVLTPPSLSGGCFTYCFLTFSFQH